MSGIPSLVLLAPACAADVGRRSAVNRDALFHVCGTILWARDGEIRRLSPIMGRLVVALYGARGQTMAYREAFDTIFADDPDGGGALDLVKSTCQRRRDSRASLHALGVTLETRSHFGYRLHIAPVAPLASPSLRIVASADDWMLLRAAALRSGAAA